MKRLKGVFLTVAALAAVIGLCYGSFVFGMSRPDPLIGGDFFCPCGARWIIIVEQKTIGVYLYEADDIPPQEPEIKDFAL